MAIITTASRLNFGSFQPRQAQVFNNLSFNQTTSNGGLAFPFIAERTMTVTDIGAVVSGISTNQGVALQIGIQTDNGSGLPSGTFLTNGSITLPANTWVTNAQFSASSGNSILNSVNNHYLKVGDLIRFANTTGGVTTGIDYWVASVPAANQMTLSSSPTLSPVFTFSASVSPGANTFNMSDLGWTHCDGITASITQNSRYWLVYQWSGSGTGQIFFNAGDTSGASGQSTMYGLGYATRSASTWSKVTTTRGIPVMYTDGTNWYGQPQMSSGRVTGVALAGTDRIGFRFSIPAGHPDILIDRVAFPTHPTASPGASTTWRAQLFTDNGAGTPTLITQLSAISGDSLGNNAGSGNFVTTFFQTDGSVWLSAGSSYILVCGFSVSPASGSPFVNRWTGQILQSGRSGVVGAYNGGLILDTGTWSADNPNTYLPFGIISAALRYNDSSGGGGGGYVNASAGFGALGGN